MLDLDIGSNDEVLQMFPSETVRNRQTGRAVKSRVVKVGKKITAYTSEPKTTGYGYGVSSSSYDIYFNDRYEASQFINKGGGYLGPIVGFGVGTVTGYVFTKAAVPSLGIIVGAAGALTEAGQNAMLEQTKIAIDEVDPNSRIKITVTSWDIPQNKGYEYMKEYYTVSTW